MFSSSFSIYILRIARSVQYVCSEPMIFLEHQPPEKYFFPNWRISFLEKVEVLKKKGLVYQNFLCWIPIKISPMFHVCVQVVKSGGFSRS